MPHNCDAVGDNASIVSPANIDLLYSQVSVMNQCLQIKTKQRHLFIIHQSCADDFVQAALGFQHTDVQTILSQSALFCQNY